MQLLIFIAAIGFFVLRILASSKKKQPETAENGAANRFAENESDEFAFGTGFAQGKPKPAAQNRTEGRAYSASDSYCGTANCTGGSIHEGAHEGEVRAPRSPYGTGGGNMRSNASSGKKPQQAKRQRKLRHGSPPPQSDPMTIPHMSKNNRLKVQKKCRAERTGCLKPSRLSPQLPRALSGMRFFPHPLRQEIRIDTADF